MDEKTTDVLLIIVVVVLLVFTAVWIALLAVFCFLKRQKGFSIFSRSGNGDNEKNLGQFYGSLEKGMLGDGKHKKTQTKEVKMKDSGTDPAVELFTRQYKVPQKNVAFLHNNGNIDPDSYPEFTLAKVPPYLQTEEPKELSPPASSRSDDHNKNTKRKVVRVGKSAKQRSSGHSTGGSNPNGDDRSERSMNMDSTQEADSTNTM
ncbi:uncharacterized protein LOC142342207 isoform X2 [Convolutriloba macropyga]|uniref:uncharacterized protein LOC142342207 isoform X2 n=1 Tax=Convolutriloba macropyga TaxID=536237 RepID=UPI003F51DDF5